MKKWILMKIIIMKIMKMSKWNDNNENIMKKPILIK